jgi:hypothetical protein
MWRGGVEAGTLDPDNNIRHLQKKISMTSYHIKIDIIEYIQITKIQTYY